MKESAWQKTHPNMQMVKLVKSPEGSPVYIDKFTQEPVKTEIIRGRMEDLYNQHYTVAIHRRK